MKKRICNLTELIIKQSTFKITYHRDIKVFSISQDSYFSILDYCTQYIYWGCVKSSFRAFLKNL